MMTQCQSGSERCGSLASPPNDEHVEELAETIYHIILGAQGNVNMTFIVCACPLFESLDNIQKAVNLLVNRGVIGWETKTTYGDTIYVRG